MDDREALDAAWPEIRRQFLSNPNPEVRRMVDDALGITREEEPRDTYTLIRAIGKVRTQYGVCSLEAWDMISNTAKAQTLIDLEEFSRNDLTVKIHEAAKREGATAVLIDWDINRNYELPDGDARGGV